MKCLWSILIMLFAFIFVRCSSPLNLSSEQQRGQLYYNQGTNFLVSEDYTQALDYLMQAEQLDPSNSKIQNNLGMAYFFKEKPDLAINHLQKAIELDPKNSDAKNNIGSVYFYQKKYDKAEGYYKQVAEDLIYPHQYRTYYNLALIAEQFKDYRKAQELYDKSVKEKSDYCPAHMGLGKLAYRISLYQSAHEHFKEASSGLCASNVEALYYQAIVLGKMGQDQSADKIMDDIVERFPKSTYAQLVAKHRRPKQ